MQTVLTIAATATLALASTSLGAATDAFAGFDGGANDGFTGNAFFEANGGNPGGNAHFDITTFFPSLRTGGIGEPANGDFLGDFSSFTDITISFDVKVDALTDFIGNDIVRPIGISLIDRDIQGPSGPSGVFFEMGLLSSAAFGDWTTLSVTISDPTQAALPAGWIGFGDEDPNTFEPILPPGASFASVLASVDQFEITGAVPGFFFNNANFDMRIDNIRINAVPAPATLALLLPAFLMRRRRR